MAKEISSVPLRPAKVQPPATPGASGLTTLAVAIVVIVALYLGNKVFVPLVLAVLLSFVLGPAANLLRRIRVPRIPEILVTVVLALAVLLGVGGVIGPQLADLAGQLPRYQHTVETKIEKLQTGIMGHASALIHKATIAVNQNTAAPGGRGAGGHSGPERSEGKAASGSSPAGGDLVAGHRAEGARADPLAADDARHHPGGGDLPADAVRRPARSHVPSR